MYFKKPIIVALALISTSATAYDFPVWITDNLGNHTAEQNVNLNQHFISGSDTLSGVFIDHLGQVSVGLDKSLDAQLQIKGEGIDNRESVFKMTNTLDHVMFNIQDNGDSFFGMERQPGPQTAGLKFTAAGGPSLNLYSFVTSTGDDTNRFAIRHDDTRVKMGFYDDDKDSLIINTSGHVGIGIDNPVSALQVDGYIQLALTNGKPLREDCDDSNETGRMKIDSTAGLLYVCNDNGWFTK